MFFALPAGARCSLPSVRPAFEIFLLPQLLVLARSSSSDERAKWCVQWYYPCAIREFGRAHPLLRSWWSEYTTCWPLSFCSLQICCGSNPLQNLPWNSAVFVSLV